MEQQERKVSVLLIIGIVAMPYIFCWFLLRKGYNNKARLLSFCWAAIFGALVFFSDSAPPATVNNTQPAISAQTKTTSDNPMEVQFDVPSDPKARFYVLEKSSVGAERTIVTKRVGSSGTSYSRRLYNCDTNTVKYLGTGDTLAEMHSAKAEEKMSPVVRDSIAYFVGLQVCRNNRANTASETLSSSAPSQWQYSENEDPMTGGKTKYASVISANSVEFDFPYNGTQNGKLTLRIDPKYGKDVIFSIEKGQILCDSYDGCTVLVRFDEGQPTKFSANAAADQSTNVIFISNYSKFVEKLKQTKRLRISPSIYQEGNPVFEFDVSDFDDK